MDGSSTTCGCRKSGLQELIASYQNTVLTANQEVEDALVAFLRNQQRVRFLESTVKETQEALRLLTISFNEGDISFTGVFIMQGDLAAKQDQLAQARGRRRDKFDQPVQGARRRLADSLSRLPAMCHRRPTV